MENKQPILPRISRPLTETEQFENMLNLGDISEITPEPSEEDLQRIRRLQLQLQEAQRDVEVRDKQIENLKRTQRHLENHQELQRKKIATLEERQKAQEAELRRLRDAQSQVLEAPDSSALEEKVRELTEENGSLKRESARLSREANRKDDLLAENGREIESYKAELESLKLKLEEMNAAHREQLQKISQQKEKAAETVDAALLVQAKLNAANLRKQLLEGEKRAKAAEAEIAEGKRAKETLRQQVRELEQALKRQKKQSVIHPLPQIISDVDDGEEGEAGEGLELSVEQKSVRRSMQQLSKLHSLGSEGRIRLLNSIIANAENELDLLLAFQK